MDYPKSVPNIGLVNGKFVDENVGTGQPGSLIPSAWGSAVTDEILAVITAAGLVPNEATLNQLNAAINTKISSAATVFASQAEAEAGAVITKAMSPLRVFQAIAKVVVQATEAVFGWAKVATQAQVSTGTDDATIVTPKKLRAAQATQAEAEAGVDNSKTMTPQRVFQAIDKVVGQATETNQGTARFGTPGEQAAGVLKTVMSNPAGVMALLAALFPKRVFSANDYIRIPDVPGGLIVQWGFVAAANSQLGTVSYPVPFQTAARGGSLQNQYTTSDSNTFMLKQASQLTNAFGESLNGFTWCSTNTTRTLSFTWLVWGN